MVRLDNLEKRLNEWGYQFEVGKFKTERGVFAVKMPKSDTLDFLNFCRIYQITGIREGNSFYCYYLSSSYSEEAANE